MSRLFISHSSKNNAQAIALRRWLDESGWGEEEVFLDISVVEGIPAGVRWREALKAAGNRCEAVLVILSRAWLASVECRAELSHALYLGKRIFGALVEPLSIEHDLPVELRAFQIVNLAAAGERRAYQVRVPPADEAVDVSFQAQQLQILRRGLENAGLDARTFPFDETRPIFRGLRALEEQDAAIFFGREGKIVEALDELRTLADKGGSKFFVILGASGVGKSSFLRAGLWPRLARDDRTFMTLPVVRPERAAITGERGLVEALLQAATVVDLKNTRASIEAALVESDGLSALLHELREAARARLTDPNANPPLAVLPIDQGEELFSTDAGSESGKLLKLICPLVKGPLLVLLCMRSDGFEQLQHAPQLFENMVDVRVFSLAPMPAGAFQGVIEGPVKRLQAAKGTAAVKLDPMLTNQLLVDIGGDSADALPVLAFVLERLYRKYNVLALADYRTSGGLQGAIVDAAAEALKNPKAEPVIPEDAETQRRLLRKAFIPYLARIDEHTGEARRCIAKLEDIPTDARPLVERLVQVRLLVKHQPLDKAGEPDPDKPVQVEPAHEALLRQWPELEAWLKEEKGYLIQLEQILRAANDWNANDRAPEWLVHKAGRLTDAEALSRREHYAKLLYGVPRAYLAAARTAEDEQRTREREQIEREKVQLKEVAQAQRQAELEIERTKAAQALASESLEQKSAAQKARDIESGRRIFWWRAAVAIAGVALVAVSIGAWFAVVGRREAIESGARAERNLSEALTNHSRFLADQSRQRLAKGDQEGALAIIVEALSGSHPFAIPTETRVQLASATYPTEGWWIAPPMRHRGPVWSVSFSPTGDRVLTAAEGENAVRLWDTVSAAPIGRPMTHDAEVLAVAFSSDGKRVATASSDGTVRLWNALTGEPLGKPLRHADRVDEADFSPNGKALLSVSSKSVLLWDAVSGAQIGRPMAHDGQVTSAKFNPDGRSILTVSSDGLARLWDVAGATQPRATIRHEHQLSSAAFSPDGTRILTLSNDNTARLWTVGADPIGSPMKHGHVLDQLNGEPLDDGGAIAKFSPDGRAIVTYGEDGDMRLWDGFNGAPIGGIMRNDGTYYGDQEIGIISVDFTPDSTRLIATAVSGVTRTWDARTGGLIASAVTSDAGILNAALSPDGTRMALSLTDNTVRIVDATRHIPKPPLRHDGEVDILRFGPDGRSVVTAFGDTALIWNTHSATPQGTPLKHGGRISSVAFSMDGNRIATASHDMTVRLWNASTGAAVGQPMRHEAQVSDVRFSSDGKRLLSYAGYEAKLWDTRNGAAIGSALRHDGSVFSTNQRAAIFGAFFSHDGQRVVTISNDHTARLWDAATGEAIGSPMQHGGDGAVRAVAFEPADRWFVSSGDDGFVRKWDTATATQMFELAHAETASVVVVSPDGGRILTAAGEKAQLWDSTTGLRLGRAMSHEGTLSTAVFSPDGRKILTASYDGARLWNTVDSEGLVSIDVGIESAVFDSSGRRILTGLGDSTAQLWDSSNGAPLGAPLGVATTEETLSQRGFSRWRGPQFSSDSRYVATAWGKEARLWNVDLKFPKDEEREDVARMIVSEVLTAKERAALALPSAPYAPPVEETDCDVEAGDPSDPGRRGAGKSLVDIDAKKAAAACKEAIAQSADTPRYHFQLGRALWKGEDIDGTLAAYADAANSGYAMANANLGWLLSDPSFPRPDAGAALAHFDKAMNQHIAVARAYLARRLWDGGVIARDRPRAMAEWRRAVEEGTPEAHAALGDLYFTGEARDVDVPQNFEEALYHWAAAVEIMAQHGRDDESLRERKAGMARYFYHQGRFDTLVKVSRRLARIRSRRPS